MPSIIRPPVSAQRRITGILGCNQRVTVSATTLQRIPGEIAFLYRVAQVLLQDREYGEILAGLLDLAIEGLGADRGFVVVHERGKFAVTVARNFSSDSVIEAEEEISDTISAAVVKEGKTLSFGDAFSAELLREKSSVHRLALRSVLCGPLVVSKEAFALLYLENRSVRNCFSERQRQLMDEICALASPRLRAAVAAVQAAKRARAIEDATGGLGGIFTADEKMAELLKTVRQIAPTDLPVLIQGETGTGKELIARLIYRLSTRSSGEYAVLNCAAIPASLIESELFGCVRGAFTGAVRDRAGLIASAHRGTCFLDEIGEMPLDLQPRLLRVLQSGELTRVGAVRPETVDVRFVAATNRDLDREVEEDRFRSDLFFRLATITLKVPPLRERRGDIRLLSGHFLIAYARRYGREAPRLNDDCLAALEAYGFPGNVRELESEIARLVAVSPPGSEIGAGALNERIGGKSDGGRSKRRTGQPLPAMSLGQMEKQMIESVLESTGGNRTRSADILGISREGLRIKMQRLGISGGS